MFFSSPSFSVGVGSKGHHLKPSVSLTISRN